MKQLIITFSILISASAFCQITTSTLQEQKLTKESKRTKFIDSTVSIKNFSLNPIKYNQYIGLEVYSLPREIIKSAIKNHSTTNEPFLILEKPTVVTADSVGAENIIYHPSSKFYSALKAPTTKIEKIQTHIVDPVVIDITKKSELDLDGKNNFISIENIEITNGNQVDNQYFIIEDVIFGNRLYELQNFLDKKNTKSSDSSLYIDDSYKFIYSGFDHVVFKIRDKKSGLKYYTKSLHEHFISVPHFNYLRNKYLNEDLIYFSGSTRGTCTENDYRYTEDKTNYAGEVIKVWKKTTVNEKDVFKCIDVTVMQAPINKRIIVLENIQGERVYCEGLNKNFMLKKDYDFLLKQKKEKELLQKDILEERRKKERLALERKKEARISFLKSKYGSDYLIYVENKVRIGMTKEMCIDSWGIPNFTETIITNGVKTEKMNYGYETYLKIKNNKLVYIKNTNY